MTTPTYQTFLQRFPGPYSFEPGTDGVDNTFDIYCRTSGERIISACYWEARDAATLNATVLTHALEYSRLKTRNMRISQSLQNALAKFATNYPGPYYCKEYHHSECMAEIGVASQQASSMIVSLLTIPGCHDSRQIAWYLAHSLNRLFGHPAQTIGRAVGRCGETAVGN
jgi:hypothetical protein